MTSLGLDLGTSGLKGVVVDDDDAVIAEATAPLPVSRPRSGWSEQDPAEWIRAAEAVLDALTAKADLSAVEGIGLSGQMHGATLLDEADRPLRPCILWNDTRAHVQAAAMDADPRWRRISGNIVFPGFTAPKLAWVADEEPEIFTRTKAVLLPKDYLRLWLTGERVSEMSDASGTSWLDVGARDWSDELLGLSRLSREAMPRLVEGSESSGGLRSEIASRWGLAAGTPVAGGGGDNAASAVGVGAVAPGHGFVSLGTSGVLFAPTASFAPAPETAVHAFCHALPGLWHQMGVILSATDSLSWYGRLVGAEPATLAEEVGSLRAPGRTLFLPYLGGERTPLNDAAIRGAFLGLEHATDRAAGARAVMEGVVFALRDCRDALTAAGSRIERLTALGGGAASDYWLSALATALGATVDRPREGAVGAALGAARLGRMAAGGGGPEIARPAAPERSFEPDPTLAPAFDEAFERYNAARKAVSGLS